MIQEVTIILENGKNFLYKASQFGNVSEFLKELSTQQFAQEIPFKFFLTYQDDENDEIAIINNDDFLTWSEQAPDFPLKIKKSEDSEQEAFTLIQFNNLESSVNPLLLEQIIQKEMDRQFQLKFEKIQQLFEVKQNNQNAQNVKNKKEQQEQVQSIRKILEQKIIRFEELQDNILKSDSLNECGHNIQAFWDNFKECEQILQDQIETLKQSNYEQRKIRNKQRIAKAKLEELKKKQKKMAKKENKLSSTIVIQKNDPKDIYSENVLAKTMILAELLKVDPEYLYEYVKENQNDSADALAMKFLK